jgi:sulfite exporter TauE/SafE
MLGAVAGLLGSALNLGGELVGFTEVASVLAAALMIAWGVVGLLPKRGRASLRRPWRPGAGGFSMLLHRASRYSPLVRAALLGTFTGALPCGWLYAFVVLAAGTGTAHGGLALMSSFWLGTVPALVGVGALVRPVARWLGQRAPTVGAAALVFVGLSTLTARYVFAPAPEEPQSCPLHSGGMAQR